LVLAADVVWVEAAWSVLAWFVGLRMVGWPEVGESWLMVMNLRV
jgi:hypothetical protein